MEYNFNEVCIIDKWIVTWTITTIRIQIFIISLHDSCVILSTEESNSSLNNTQYNDNIIVFWRWTEMQIRNRCMFSNCLNIYLSWIKKKKKEARMYRWHWAIDSLKHCSISIVWERFYRVWARIMRHEMAVLVSSTHLAKVKASSTSTKLPLKRSRETRTTNDPLCTRSLRSTTLPSIPITYSVFSCDHFLSLSLFRGHCYSICNF